MVVQRSSVGRGAEECQSGEAHAGMCWVDQLTCKNYGVHGKDVARGGDGTWWAGAVRVSVKVDERIVLLVNRTFGDENWLI